MKIQFYLKTLPHVWKHILFSDCHYAPTSSIIICKSCFRLCKLKVISQKEHIYIYIYEKWFSLLVFSKVHSCYFTLHLILMIPLSLLNCKNLNTFLQTIIKTFKNSFMVQTMHILLQIHFSKFYMNLIKTW